VFVLLGNPDGTFQPAVRYSVPGDSFAAAIGDFNGDGIPDLAVVGPDSLNVLRGNGDGTFGGLTSYLVGSTLTSVAVGNFNGNGPIDLAVGIRLAPDVTVVLNRNDGLAPGGGDAPRPPHPADTTLGQAVAQTLPEGLRVEKPTTTASAGGQETAADAYFAALANEEPAIGFPQHRPENRIAVRASRPVGYLDEDLTALAAELTAPIDA
jgi:hypothetical protein